VVRPTARAAAGTGSAADVNAPPIIWQPSAERIERATITRFRRHVEAEHGRRLPDYEALRRWSVDELEAFWGSVASFFEVPFSTPPERVLGARKMPGADWFPGARLNLAEAILTRAAPDDRVAIRHASELRPLATLTWGELRAQVARIAAGLEQLGVGEGDRVAAYLPNVPETVAAFLATASLGAIWSSAAPEFGARAVADRFAQIEPTVLLTVDGYRYGGKDVPRLEVVAGLLEELPTVRHTVVLPLLDPDADPGALRGGMRWDGLERAGADRPLVFAQVPFAHPLWILYSSGTTGLPKAIVHGQGGVLLELTKVLNLHVDAQDGDRLFWFTTTGWMMWNFLVGGLLTEAEIVLYDGSPGYPETGALWGFAAEAGITIFGTSAAYIGACAKAGVSLADQGDLSALHAVGSTGSPLPPEGFDWVHEQLGDVWLFSTSGGTDVCTAFVGGVPTLPVTRGELQARSLGAAVEAWSADGQPLVGEVGELVLTRPMPSMPVFFWNDPDRSRYRESYFAPWPGIWRHGDWIEITARGTAIITGRSDATINRGGVRIGTSEIYRVVLALDEVVDALVVDVPLPGTQGVMPLFVVLRPEVVLDDALTGRIRAAVREGCSPRHVPDEVVAVPAVPRTLSGKALELPVKRILMGQPADAVASRDALADPSSLEWFEDYGSGLASRRGG
jgi:acetoacetyl-CoA synthetase